MTGIRRTNFPNISVVTDCGRPIRLSASATPLAPSDKSRETQPFAGFFRSVPPNFSATSRTPVYIYHVSVGSCLTEKPVRVGLPHGLFCHSPAIEAPGTLSAMPNDEIERKYYGGTMRRKPPNENAPR